MPYQGHRDGLYVLRQVSQDKGVFHYGVMDVGNQLGLTNVLFGSEPYVVHQRPGIGLHAQPISGTGVWTIIDRIHDENVARIRLLEAMKTPTYSLFGNNCEHFVNFLKTGVRTSPQVIVGGILAMVALALLVETTKGRKLRARARG